MAAATASKSDAPRERLSRLLRAASPGSPPEDESDLEGLMSRSDDFARLNPYPIDSTLTRLLLHRGRHEPELLLRNVNRSYPLLHEDLIALFGDFLAFKLRRGTEVEKGIYSGMDITQFVDRLLEKRPLLFVGAADRYVLRNRLLEEDASKHGGHGGFELIGSEEESPPLVMRDYLTYDEMKLSALLATCSPTATINRGDRHNKGICREEGSFIGHAYIVGLVGTRLVKPDVMECQDMRITREQNVGGGGRFYGRRKDKAEETLADVFARFYGIHHFPVYKEVEELLDPGFVDKLKSVGKKQGDLEASHFVAASNFGKKKGKKSSAETSEYFHLHAYKRRVRLTAETLLAEANERARAEGKKAYVHVVGLGLGVWRLLSTQNQWYVDAFASCLGRMRLNHVSDVDFSWIGGVSGVDGVESGQIYPGTDIRVHLSMRDPYEPFQEGTGGEGKVVVSSWAYDGNSYPGNEYWVGSLQTSSDPAAACATQVPELHNPLVNLKMRGSNLHIATKEGRVLTLSEYLKS